MTRVELRVHGVSGTPPEDMLGTDRACQVHGDDFGRVFRRADRLGNVLDRNDGVEAYHWGRQTSGSPLQGLWLLLAPFGMVNAAQYMLEIPRSGSAAPSRTSLAEKAYWTSGAALRLTGLALTLMFVLTAAIITLDLWAWQRAQASTGAAFALALLGPVVLLTFYFFVARTTPKLNVAPEKDPKAATRGDDDFGRSTALLRPGFFEGNPDVPALRSLHLTAGLALVALIAFGQGTGGGRLGWWGSWTSGGLLVLALIAVVFLGDPEGSSDPRWESPTKRVRDAQIATHHLARVLFGAAVVAFVVSAIHLWSVPFPEPVEVLRGAVGEPRAPEHFRWIDEASLGMMLAAVVGLAILAVSNGVLAVRCATSPARTGVAAFAPYARGMGCTLVASIGVFLGVGFAGAFTTALAEVMSTEQRPVMVPELLSRITYAWGLTVVLVLLLVIAVLLNRWWRLPDFDRKATVELGVPVDSPSLPAPGRLRTLLNRWWRRPDLGEKATVEPGVPTDAPVLPAPRWLRKLGSAMWLARLKNRAPCVLTTFVAFGALLTAATVYETSPLLFGPFPQDGGPWLGWVSGSANENLEGVWGVLRNAAIAVGALALSALAGLLLTLGRKALSGEAARRGSNVIWDVIAFWPRSTHPFVPATYAQRAVPDLEARIAHHLSLPKGNGRPDTVVLCGHSQGSLLAFAALLRLATDPERKDMIEHVGLVTFGSQLQVMFARGFPGYVNHTTIERLHDRLGGRWRNLYRTTDPLAGPVLSWRCRGVDHGHPGLDGRCHIGGQVGSGAEPTPHRREYGPDWRIFDPPNPADDPNSPDPREPARGTTFLPLRGHSDFWLDSAWDAALTAVSGGDSRPAWRPPAELRAADRPG